MEVATSGLINGLVWSALILVIALLGWALRRPHASRIAADRPDQPYTIFTTDFDLVTRGRDFEQVLADDGDLGQFPLSVEEPVLDNRRNFEQASFQAARSPLRHKGTLAGVAICFLVDMSGSMVNVLPMLAGHLRALHENLLSKGATCAVYGFTTRGWRGGFPREAWFEAGRPDYPGRLCALQHVILADFDEAIDRRDWDGLLLADGLRENIDGEALRWASERLGARPERDKTLFVISDGAPVDDATISANGSWFLVRDLLKTISEIETAGTIALYGVGISHRVNEYYPRSTSIEDVAELTGTVERLIERR